MEIAVVRDVERLSSLKETTTEINLTTPPWRFGEALPLRHGEAIESERELNEQR